MSAEHSPQPGTAVTGLDGFSHHYADVNGTRLHAVIGGRGPAVVLLHGWPYTWTEWRRVMPELAEQYTVIAPDLRGIGDSDKPASGYAKSNVAQDVRALVQQLGHQVIRLVGTDIGMMVAYAYAAAHPDEVSHLVLCESLLPGFGLEEQMNPATGGYWTFGFHMQVEIATMLTEGKEAAYLTPLWQMFAPVHGADETATAEYLRHYAAPGGMRSGFQHYGVMLDDGKENRVNFHAKLDMPVLVLNGERGIPQDQTAGCVKQVAANMQAEQVPDAGHTLAEENPAWFAARLKQFFGDAVDR